MSKEDRAADVMEGVHETSEGLSTIAIAARNPPAADALFAALYQQLKRLARRELRRQGARDFLGTGTLIHEAWLNMHGRDALAFEGPERFLAYAARAMRGLAIDRVRAHRAGKRGGDAVTLSLDDDEFGAAEPAAPAAPALDGVAQAVEALATFEPQLAQVVDLKFFGGFTLIEIAAMQGVSERTAQRQWDKARLWLHQALLP